MSQWGKCAAIAAAVVLLSAWDHPLFATPITVPDYSFDNPTAPTVSPYATSGTGAWLHPAPPSYWAGTGQTTADWDNTVGVFYNIGGVVDNLDGSQGAFFFAAPQNELYQDLTATFQVGYYYYGSFWVEGGGSGMPLGTPLQLSLYYRDAGNNPITIASASVTATNTNNDQAGNPLTHLTQYQFDSAIVQASDPWAGKPIGIAITSLSDFSNGSGYWDIDNVQLASILPEPASLGIFALGALALCLRRRRA